MLEPAVRKSATGLAAAAWTASRGLPTRSRLAERPHGTRLRYISGCRCMLCRAANSRYECGRAAARRRGGWNGLVPAIRARMHIEALSCQGVGFKSVALAADVGKTVVLQVRTGQKRQIRAETERRILAVDRAAIADGGLVPARPTWRRIAALLDEGFSKAELARRLGYQRPALQLGRRRITARNAVRVERLFNRVME